MHHGNVLLQRVVDRSLRHEKGLEPGDVTTQDRNGNNHGAQRYDRKLFFSCKKSQIETHVLHESRYGK